MINKNLKNHFQAYGSSSVFEKVTVFLITKDGQVLEKLGNIWEGDTASLGALFVGILEASEAVKESVTGDTEGEMDLSYSSSKTGFFILKPTENNPDIFWAFLYKEAVNPGKIRVYGKKLRDHFNQIKILEKHSPKSDKDLFKNITDEEMDNLFSFAGI
ncbi:MAG: hypothetical protein NXH75_11645 [Halobacteriovoraceae bacterium]|nr:hypothetical protein [Halobacteriovoraceae bacterium]